MTNDRLHGDNAQEGSTAVDSLGYSPEQEADDAGGLDASNYANLVSYLLNVVLTYGISTGGWIGNGSNPIISEKYQTLFTPSAAAFGIWGVIFAAQAVFAVAQLLPRFRSAALVREGVGYLYVSTCLWQVLWTIAFAYEIIWLSTIFMAGIWISLLAIVYRQQRVVVGSEEGGGGSDKDRDEHDDAEPGLMEFWLLRFPFSIHFGWVTVASVLSANVQLVSLGKPPGIQLSAGIASAAVLFSVAVWALFVVGSKARGRPNYTVAVVVAWAAYWIHRELASPKDSISERFGEIVTSGVGVAADFIAVAILVLVVSRASLPAVAPFLVSHWDGTEEVGQEDAEDEEGGGEVA